MAEPDRQAFVELAETVSYVDQLTFYAHDILADSSLSTGRIRGMQGVERQYQQDVVVDGVHYGLTVKEFGLPRGSGKNFVESYGEISVERRPYLSSGGKFVIDTARWAVNGPVGTEEVARREEGASWLGRLRNKTTRSSYVDVLAKNDWVEKTLTATGRVKQGEVDG